MRRLVLLALLIVPRTARATIVDGVADEVFGQPDMTSGAAPTTTSGSTLSSPRGLSSAYGSSLLIADTAHHRIVGVRYSPPPFELTASLVVGQATYVDGKPNRGGDVFNDGLSAPGDVSFDSVSSRFAIADAGNHRVMIASGEWFEGMVGQASFASSAPGVSSSTLNAPRGVSMYAWRLLVADTGNHRIVEFNVSTGSKTASACYGQLSCDLASANAGGAVSVNVFRSPSAVAWNASTYERYFVVDTGNHRVLERLGNVSQAVYGQAGSFTTAKPGSGALLLSSPVSIAIDRNNGFWVVDQGNRRVVHFRRGNMFADRVLGQPSLDSAVVATAPSASTFVLPSAVAVGSNGDVFVADAGAHRVLRFKFACAPGVCDDGNPCTKDSCDDVKGCAFGFASESADACYPYRCDLTNKACLGNCATRPCQTGYHCTSTKRCVRTCSDSEPCPAGGTCINGACCDRPCTGRCEACDLFGREGTCAAIVGKPRRPCASSDECAGECNGANRVDCDPRPPGEPCGAESCEGSVERRRGTCDGAGKCSSEQRACVPFICGGGACLTSCLHDFECADGARCDHGACAAIRVSGEGCAHAGAVETTLGMLGVWALGAVGAVMRRRRAAAPSGPATSRQW